MDCRLVVTLVLCVGITAPNTDASQVTTTSVGKDVTLRCQIPNLDSDLRFLYWRKDGNTIYSRIGNGENAVGKYSVIDATSLLIPDVEDNDAGNFSCKVVRQSLNTEESDMIQLLVLDLSVSNCKDIRQDVDGCSCYINGSDIPSLDCSASGFPHSPVITWDESEITYRSSSVDLTRYNKNLTLVCKARDRNLQSVVANKTVCVHYSRGVKPNGPTGETPVPPVRNEALVAAIILGTLLAFVCLALLILWLIYRHKMGKDLCLRTRFFWTSSPKTSREPLKSKLRAMNSSGYGSEMGDVFKDSFKHSEASSTPEVSKLDGIEAVDMDHVDYFTKDCNEDVPKTSREPPKRTLRGMNSSGYGGEMVDIIKDSFKISEASSIPDIRTVDLDHVDYFPKDCNEDFMADDEPPLPLVGQVLLDDLKSSTEEDRESMKAVILALLEQRIELYKMHQAHVDPYVTVKTSSSDLNETLQRSMMIDKFSDPDAPFVDMVLQDLDRILDERDRDECEILITKPGFQEVTDESEIPAYQGDRVTIHRSLRMHQVKSSHMNDSMVARIPLSSVLREELLKKPSERSTIRNDISQIILDFMKKGHSGLTCRTSNNLKCSTSTPMDTNVDGEVFRLVAFWTSKIVKLDNDVNNHIRKYLFPLKPRITNKCPDADPQIARLQEEEEEEEIPETPSSAKLLEESIQR